MSNKQVRRSTHIIEPARARISAREVDPGQAHSMRWLAKHGHEYMGKWIALSAGKFLGAASSREVLVEKLGQRALETGILITKVTP